MKKIIFMTYDFPYPFNSGGKIRAYNLLKYAGKGYDITVYSFTRGEVSFRQKKKLEEIGIKNIKFFPRPKQTMVSKLRSLPSNESIFKKLYYSKTVEDALIADIHDKKIDIVHCESFYTSFYINKRVLETGVKTIYGSENIEYKIYDDYVKSSVSSLLKPIYGREVAKIKNEELLAARQASGIIAITDEEADYFNDISNTAAEVVTNGIDLDYFRYRKRNIVHPFNILFVGNFKYFPNISSVKFIYESVYSKLDKSDFSLTIIGNGAENLSIPRERNIKLIDYIDDIRDAYYAASAFIFPVTLGGGTNFKVLEAMATGVPIIARDDRIQSLGAEKMKQYISANTGQDFVNEITKVMNNPAQSSAIAKSARTFVAKNYSWEVIGKKLHSVWKSL